jgi:peroxiredoxin
MSMAMALLMACQEEVPVNAFSIDGSFDSCPLDSVHVYQLSYEVGGFFPQKLLSAPVVDNGGKSEFHLEGELPGQGFYLVGKAPQNMTIMVLGGEKGIKLSGNCNDLRQYGQIDNSELNQSFKSFSGTFNSLQQKLNQANQQLMVGMQSQNAQFMTQAREQILDAYGSQAFLVDSLARIHPVLASYFKANLFEPFDPENNPKGYTSALEHFGNEYLRQVDFSNPVYEHIPLVAENVQGFTQQLVSNNVPQDQAETYFDNFLNALPEGATITRNCYAVMLNTMAQLKSGLFVTYADRYRSIYMLDDKTDATLDNIMSSIQADQKAKETLAIGAIPPEIELPTPEGGTMKLSDLRGKVVLLDFWASWCRPCRAENPNVVRVYNKYKNKGFDILSVSLDRSRGPWLQAIEKDKMTWHHVSDLKYWQSVAAKTYRVSSIPATFLLDKDGKIIAKNLRGPALEAKLKEVLGSS